MCVIQDMKSLKRIGTAELKNGLYYIKSPQLDALAHEGKFVNNASVKNIPKSAF